MNGILAPAWLIAGNLAFFCLVAAYLLSRSAILSHHWIFLILEAILFAQAELLRGRALQKTVFFLSAAVLSVSLFRIETIYLSRHLIHFSLAWAAGGILHFRLRRTLPDSLLFSRINAILIWLCAVSAAISFILALHQGIWWGIGPGK